MAFVAYREAYFEVAEVRRLIFMEGLTREKTIELHRQLWNYIADETEKQQKVITKEEAFKHFGWSADIEGHCWCCEYDMQFDGWECDHCPVKWPTFRTFLACFHGSLWSHDNKGLYGKWLNCSGWKDAAKIARKIANLPENPEA